MSTPVCGFLSLQLEPPPLGLSVTPCSPWEPWRVHCLSPKADIPSLLISHRPQLQDVELGDWAGDRSSQRPPQQCGLHQVLQPLRTRVLRVHLLHQGVGHSGLSQVHSDTHVSAHSLGLSHRWTVAGCLGQCFSAQVIL